MAKRGLAGEVQGLCLGTWSKRRSKYANYTLRNIAAIAIEQFVSTRAAVACFATRLIESTLNVIAEARPTDERCRSRNPTQRTALQVSNTNAFEDWRIDKTRRATLCLSNDPKMKLAFKIVLLLAGSVALGVFALAQELRRSGFLGIAAAPDQPRMDAESNNSFLVQNVRIFDGTRLIRANSVFVKNGRIEQLGVGLIAASDTTVIDGSGDTLLPGLIDSHVHTYVLPPL